MTVIVSIASTLTVAVLAGFFLTDKIISFRRHLVENIVTLADVVGINSTASLTFDVPETAREILGALSVESRIVMAGIARTDGRLFATYRNPEFNGPPELAEGFFDDVRRWFAEPSAWPARGHVFSPSHLDVIRPIRLKDIVIGHVAIRADLGPLTRRIILSAAVALLLIGALWGFVHLIAKRLHRSVVDPVLELTRTMESVSRRRDYSTRVTKVYDDEVGMLIAGFNDMLSQIQKRDDELEMHRNRLEDAVTQRTAELKRSYEQLKLEMAERSRIQDQLTRAQKMEAVGTLASGVAHDLNNILQGIVSYPELLLMQLPKDSPLRKPLETIRNSGEKAAAVVQDLLTMARRGVNASKPVDLGALIRSHIESPEHENLMRHHPHARVETRIAPDAGAVMGSRVHLEKALMNMLGNAAEAMPDGGVITLCLERRVVTTCVPGESVRGADALAAPPPGDYVLLTVADTGVGIPREDLDRIFEPFFTKKKMGRSGSGLGMTVVWGAVRDHGGFVDVASEPGRGTSFYLYFPVAEAVRMDREPEVAESVCDGGGETILVVDDVAEQREIACRLLAALRYRPVAVASGEEAVTFLERRPADLVMLDMIMEPGIDGLETCRRIIARHPDQRTIIVSGFADADRVDEARRLGMSGYLKKPYTMGTIARAVSVGLRQGAIGRAEGTKR